jgi:hypothetical protein
MALHLPAVIVLLLLFGVIFASRCGYAATPADLIGTWGYTVLGHATPGGQGYFTWKDEAGTLAFNSDGTMTNLYTESADVCPSGFCPVSGGGSSPYTAAANPDGSITVAMNPGADQTILRFVVSDDGSMFFADGTSVVDKNAGQLTMFIVGVRLDTSHAYSDGDLNGAYYAASYEHDAGGGNKGYYRLYTQIFVIDGNGCYSKSGDLSGDGSIISNQSKTGTYVVNPSGSVVLDLHSSPTSGYLLSSGKAAVFSNPSLTGGMTNDWASLLFLKQGDKTYAMSDLSGTWAMATFGDLDEATFQAGIGTMTCNVSGACTMWSKLKDSSGNISYGVQSFNATVAPDGSCNGFYLTGVTPQFSGAIGNNGNTFVMVMEPGPSGKDKRRMGLFLRCASCANLGGAALSPGWNLISLPAQPADSSIASVLSSIAGSYQVVWAYNGQAWQVYDPNDAGGSTLTTMHPGYGYWIKMTSAQTLSISGAAPPSSIPLNSGWNLVGYNGASCVATSAPSAGLSDLANLQVLWGYPSQGWQSYDPNDSSRGLSGLCPGAGYWIDVNGTPTWTLPSN